MSQVGLAIGLALCPLLPNAETCSVLTGVAADRETPCRSSLQVENIEVVGVYTGSPETGTDEKKSTFLAGYCEKQRMPHEVEQRGALWGV